MEDLLLAADTGGVGNDLIWLCLDMDWVAGKVGEGAAGSVDFLILLNVDGLIVGVAVCVAGLGSPLAGFALGAGALTLEEAARFTVVAALLDDATALAETAFATDALEAGVLALGGGAGLTTASLSESATTLRGRPGLLLR